jgi:hypothetical protein
MAGKPVRVGIPRAGGELHVFVSPEMARAVQAAQAPPTAGFGYGTPAGGYGQAYSSSQTDQMEKAASQAIGQLTQEERQTVADISHEGFQMSDVFQAYLLCSKNVPETRELLRSLR